MERSTWAPSKVMNDNSGYVGFVISLPAGTSLTDTQQIELDIDTDRNSRTGDKDGEDVTILVFGGAKLSYDYGRWNGTKTDFGAKGTTVEVASISGAILVVISKSELNNTSAFDFWLYSDVYTADQVTGTDSAPDGAATWTYDLVTKAVKLKLAKPTGHPVFPVAGAKFRISTVVTDVTSVNRRQVEGGKVQCVVRIGTKSIVGRGSFAGGVAVCTMTIPTKTSGKMLRGSIAVSVPGGQAATSYALKIL